ncbi:MAG TPA: hypothetical protein VFT23_04365 [Burkholderiales bacterium]|nr:hypothetical protein [Burkholderiales bacterium]
MAIVLPPSDRAWNAARRHHPHPAGAETLQEDVVAGPPYATLHNLYDRDDVEVALDDPHDQVEVRTVAVAEFLDVPATQPEGVRRNDQIGDDLRLGLADETRRPIVERDRVPMRNALIESSRIAGF